MRGSQARQSLPVCPCARLLAAPAASPSKSRGPTKLDSACDANKIILWIPIGGGTGTLEIRQARLGIRKLARMAITRLLVRLVRIGHLILLMLGVYTEDYGHQLRPVGAHAFPFLLVQ